MTQIAVLSVIVILLCGYIDGADGYCNFVWLTGALANTHMNGEYQVTNLLCDYRNTWIQLYPTAVTNFMVFYDDLGVWYIGPKLEVDNSVCGVFPMARAGGYRYYPYDVPVGEWDEWIVANGSWVDAREMHVYCDSSLSAGAIAGIVIGCVCGAVLIIAIIYMVVLWCSNKKHRSPSPHPQTAAEAAVAHSTISHTQQETRDYQPPSNYYCSATAWPGDGGAVGYDIVRPPPYEPPFEESKLTYSV